MSAPPLTCDQQRLVEDNRKLVPWTINHRLPYRPDGPDEMDDCIGDGYLGLVHAARRFDPDRGVKFSVFAVLTIRGYVLTGLRDRNGSADRPRLPVDKLPTSSDDDAPVGDLVPDTSVPFDERVSDRDLIDRALELLDRPQREAIVAAGERDGITRLAARTGLSRSAIQHRVTAARDRIAAAGIGPPGRGEGHAARAAFDPVSTWATSGEKAA
jgi:RNA polymerase sigma factor (sigma-70 family)